MKFYHVQRLLFARSLVLKQTGSSRVNPSRRDGGCGDGTAHLERQWGEPVTASDLLKTPKLLNQTLQLISELLLVRLAV